MIWVAFSLLTLLLILLFKLWSGWFQFPALVGYSESKNSPSIMFHIEMKIQRKFASLADFTWLELGPPGSAFAFYQGSTPKKEQH